MATEVIAKLISVEFNDELDGYVVQFWVGQELDQNPSLSQAFALLGSMDSLQRETYAMIVRDDGGEFVMEPDEELAECLVVFDEHKSVDDVDPSLARKWKSGQMAEALTTHLVNSNLFGVWRTGADEEDQDAQTQRTDAENAKAEGATENDDVPVPEELLQGGI